MAFLALLLIARPLEPIEKTTTMTRNELIGIGRKMKSSEGTEKELDSLH